MAYNISRGFRIDNSNLIMKFRNPYYIIPPGSAVQHLSHPAGENGSISLAIFPEHRYGFYYWLKWTRENKYTSPPCLVSMDWHQDLYPPDKVEKRWLRKLDQNDDGKVASFCWAKLCGNNDGQILSAAYLNLIGNIYVCCRQGSFNSSWEDDQIKDVFGKTHIIKKFKTAEALEDYLIKSDEAKVYFDIDLDFFTIKNPLNGKGDIFTYMTNSQICNLLSIKKPMIEWIFKRLCGFTIATEPEHCGGLLQSNRLLALVNSIYFKPNLFTKDCDWKHTNK
jgi:hypothetical protein